jgi:glycosyltransferase involved in cell wall biosynthesis
MKISIITVAYNSAKTIGDTLDSVDIQTYTGVEHLVIDGASQDKTVEMVLSHSNSNISLISEPDNGIYDAMNKGISKATGDIIGFLNSDDIYADAEVLAKIANAFKDPKVDIIYADLVYVTQDNSRIVRHWKSKPFLKGGFAKGWCPAHPTFYVRKSAIERLGLFDQSYKLAADMEFMLRYLEQGQLSAVYIPHVLVRMRLGGASNQSWKSIIEQNQEIFAALRKNEIPFSKVWFVVNKVASRLRQFASGLVKQHH